MRRFFIFLTMILAIHAYATDAMFEKHLVYAAKQLGAVFRTELDRCLNGNADACLRTGKDYSAKSHLIQTSTSNAMQTASYVARLYKRACTLGSAQGCREYAMIYAADTQKEKDKNARYYFKLACDKGDNEACTLLAMMPEDR